MKAVLYDVEGKEKGEVVLPVQFSEVVRPDVIRRAFHAQFTNRLQPHGTKEGAGMSYASELSKRRRSYKTVYGHGRSRTPRKTLMRRGMNFQLVGATAPNTVGGRAAHPPLVVKRIVEKINNKERRLAIRSSLAASANKELVMRKHCVDGLKSLPIIVTNDFEGFSKTKSVVNVLNNLGLSKELERVKKRKIRAGKGKMRGRKYKSKRGPLIVTSKYCSLSKSAKNIPGVDVVSVKRLNVMDLSPGAKPGRLLVMTEGALKTLKEEELFV